jgi:CubicO group peptidase (beta-lactamase class C family)
MQQQLANGGKLGPAVDAVIDQAIAANTIVGGVVLAARFGEPIYRRAAGLADREAGVPVREDTIFRFASVTKPVVATAMLALAERGVISLDDPVTRFLPDFRPRLADGETPAITLRQLVTHTAGLTYGLFEPGGDGPYHRAQVSDGMDKPGLSIEENLRRIASAPLSYPPGSAWGYSVATDVLGECLARAARQSLPELVRDLVTGPLGMTDSGFRVLDRARLATAYDDASPTPARMGAHHIVPFQGGELSFAPDRMFDERSYPSGGGGMSGTATDFLRLLEALRKGGAPILQKSSVDLLGTIEPGDFEIFRPGWRWPLGWSVLEDPAKMGTPQSPGTWAWGGVYGNSWFVDPTRELSVVVMTNTAALRDARPCRAELRVGAQQTTFLVDAIIDTIGGGWTAPVTAM